MQTEWIFRMHTPKQSVSACTLNAYSEVIGFYVYTEWTFRMHIPKTTPKYYQKGRQELQHPLTLLEQVNAETETGHQ
jgi:hypothetical protein